MRVDYGLSATSLSSLLHTARDLDTASSQKDTPQDIQAKAPAKAAQNPPSANKAVESTALESTQPISHARETFGLEILEKMSEREYQVFLRASEGMSEVEKMAAAQALYIFTESYAQDSSAPSKPTPLKNPYFNARDQFITRYIALYNGAQEVDILS